MFKEFGVLLVIFILAVPALRWIHARQQRTYRYLTMGLLAAAVLLNMGYNLKYVCPTFVYEGVPIGDSRENLFVYKNDSQFQWHILNTVSHNRKILLDEEGNLFEHYFALFSEELESIQVPEEVRQCLKESNQFQFKGALDMVKQLDYAFPEWQGGESPGLYLNEESLRGEKELVGVLVEGSETQDLYLMSAKYFRSLEE